MTTPAPKMRYCPYCQNFRLDVGFKRIWHIKSRTQRGMCSPCQQRRTLTREQLIELSRREREERKPKK